MKTGVHDAPVRGDVADLLRTAADTVRVQGPVEGFRYMNNAGRIKYLAGAFFTKWLYFASARANADDPCAAPILDKQVHDWLEREACISFNIHRTPDYERYLDTLKDWGADYDRTPVQVEKAIFDLRPGDRPRLALGECRIRTRQARRYSRGHAGRRSGIAGLRPAQAVTAEVKLDRRLHRMRGITHDQTL